MSILKFALTTTLILLASRSAIASDVSTETSVKAETAARTCFWKNSAHSFDVTSNNKVRVRASGGTYELTVGACFSLRFADAIGFRSFGSQVCPNDDLLVLDFQGRIQDRCWITDIRRVR